MSVHVLSWAWRQEVDGPTMKLVLLKLADSANDDGVCWPFRRTIARDVGVSEKTVSRHVAALRKLGLVEVDLRYREDGGKAGNVYRLAYSTQGTSAGSGGDADVQTQGSPASRPARASDCVEPEPSKDPPPVAPPTPASVDRKPVTTGEATQALLVLDDFNAIFGTSFSSVDWIAKIVRRLREHPEVDRAAHRETILAAKRRPWWNGPPSPSVVYGSGAQFERSLAAVGQTGGALGAAEAAALADEEVSRLGAIDVDAVEVEVEVDE